MPRNMLEVDNVKVQFSGGFLVLQGVSFRVDEGEVVALLGSNGAGKSTIFKTIMGVHSPISGSIIFQGKNIVDKDTSEIAKMGLMCMPEGRHIFGSLSVQENLMLGTYGREWKKEKIKEELEDIYEFFPILKERSGQRAGTLSGGEQQMLALGRALIAEPKLLLLDEPSLGLMPKYMTKVLDIVRSLKKRGLTILMAEQNVYDALDICDRGYVLESGRITQSGGGKELQESEAIKTSYLGI